MPGLQPYDSNQVSVTLGGRAIDAGRAAGKFIATEYTSELFKMTPTADGVVVRSKINNQSASIKVTVLQTSPAHALLTELYAAAQASTNGGDLMAFEVRDLNGGGLRESAARCWFEKAPASEYGSEAGEREWTLATDWLVRAVGT